MTDDQIAALERRIADLERRTWWLPQPIQPPGSVHGTPPLVWPTVPPESIEWPALDGLWPVPPV